MRRHRLALAAAVPTVLAVIAVPLLYSAPASAEAPRPAVLHPDHIGAINSDFQHGECPSEEGWGWHFVVPGNGNFVTLSVTFQSAGTINLADGDFGPPDDSHAYVYTPTDDTLLAGSATITGGNKDEFNLSHTCPGTEPTPPPTTTPPTTTPPTTTPPTTTPPTTTPPTTTPPTTTPPTTTPPTTTPPTTTPPTTTPPTTNPAPTVLPTQETRDPSVSPTVRGVKRTRTGAETLPRTGRPILPMTLLALALIGMGIALIRRSNRLAGAHRRH